MMRQIPERDGKAWRRLSADALERFCSGILDEAGSFRQRPGSAHSRYLDLFHHLRERDDQIAAVFNDQRRSNAFQQIAAAVGAGIVSREELTVFSEDTQAIVEVLTTLS